MKKFDDALASYDAALASRPGDAGAWYNRGNALSELKRFVEAIASYDRALTLVRDNAEALNNRGLALAALRRFDAALESYGKALALKPGLGDAYCSRGLSLKELGRLDDAYASFEKALALRPAYPEALAGSGLTLQLLGRYGEAVERYEKALALEPDSSHAFSGLLICANKLCDWERKAALAGRAIEHIAEKKPTVFPFTFLGYSGDPRLQLECASNFAAHAFHPLPKPLWTGERWRHDKLRIAYLSADFHDHATAHLMAELFERHDRSRFEVTAISFGIDDGSPMRQRLTAAFDSFHDCRQQSDEDIARFLHEQNTDIAIDLKGYTQDARPGILAYRPAPVQVSYLGYPGTMGAGFIDYIVADSTVIPPGHERFYTENAVRLPDCYQVNDSKRAIAEGTPERREAGLPDEGFVFCCFNQNWKITPEIFDAWMRLLRAVGGSVLWLLRDGEAAERNLRREAEARGIDPARLIFAPLLPSEEHLARHRLADLFLDTLPYNAHTTASDALWAGLPVLTQTGEGFAGRVAASLLNAASLPELITHSQADYEALALRLAGDPMLLKGYRDRLNANRAALPVFDTDRFRRHVEAAYLQMWEIWQSGEQPRNFEPVAAEALDGSERKAIT